MATVSFTAALKAEYDRLFETCEIAARKRALVDRQVDAICTHRSRYEAASARVQVPWQFIGVVHALEAGLSFRCHLHNGDPLTSRTVQVPRGRPRAGRPPFTWEDSAADALLMKKLNAWGDWSIAGTCYQLERYNGWGYRLYHRDVLSPYLWSYSCHYHCGKYVADGRWSASAVSKQIGAAVLLRRLLERGIITFGERPLEPIPIPQGPLVSRYAIRAPRDPAAIRAAEALQSWLNTFPDIALSVDGYPGKKTSAAYQVVTGHFLPGDPRATA